MQNSIRNSLNFTCNVCNQLFPKSELSPSKIQRCDYRCKACTTRRMIAYFKEHPQNWRKYKNPSRDKAYQTRRIIKIRTIISRLKQRPCTDCQGWFEPCQMQFDHLDGAQKNFELSNSHGKSLKRILEEAAKCEVVCANCHALRTQKRSRASSSRMVLEACLIEKRAA